jgi:hypothetical protein
MKPIPRIFPLIFLLIASLLLSACGGLAKTPNLAADLTPVTSPSPTAEPTPVLPPGVQAARQALAARLGSDLAAIQVKSFEKANWPDSCLGLGGEDETCTEEIIPGYGGVLATTAEQFEFRSDENGERVRLIPAAALSARQALAQQLVADPNNIQILGAEAVDWPDACLGVQVEGQVCAAVVTPGYRVILGVDGDFYEYHTDRAGSSVILASTPQPQVVWWQPGEAACEKATITSDGVNYGACEGAQASLSFASPLRAAELAEFTSLFDSFQAETPASKVRFTGQGSVTATPWQQRMIAEWARLVTQEARAGSSDPARGRAYSWRKESSMFGACHDISVYLSGEAFATSCQGGQVQNLGRLRLTSDQLRTIYSWIDNLKNFEQEQTDVTLQGNTTTRLVFSGAGQTTPTEGDQQAISDQAMQLLSQLSLQTKPEDLKTARQTLLAYFIALNEGRYADAAASFGGNYQVLRDQNPTISPEDLPALFQAACTVNGFLCNLKIKNEVSTAQVTSNEFRFIVELAQPDGSLFTLGPCCGADPKLEPPQTQFEFIVANFNGRFLIKNLPLYTP